MRAAVMRGIGQPMPIEDLELRPVVPGEVRVRLAASGVCHSDLSVVTGVIPQTLPAVLGHEGAGIVTEVGGGVSSVAVGDHVVASWVAPCRRCFQCLDGHAELCEHGIDHAFAGPYGTTGTGDEVFAAFGCATFGEETIVPEAAVVVIDRDFPLDLAALVGCGVVTGVGAVRNTAGVRSGQSVAVIGCGGVGLAAIQGARLAGADPIIAVDRLAPKLSLAEASGATHVVDASAGDPVSAVQSLTGGRGVDHALEVVGRPVTIEQAYAMARRGGTVTVVGAGSLTDQVTFGAMALMVDAKTVRGSVYGGTDPRRDIPELVRLARAGKLDLEALVSRRIGLEDLDAAVAALAAGEVARSLVVYP